MLQHLPAQTTEFVYTATGDDTKLHRQPVGRADSRHVATAALGREDRTELRERRVRQRVAGYGAGTAAVARAQAALGRFTRHAEGHGKSKQNRRPIIYNYLRVHNRDLYIRFIPHPLVTAISPLI